MSAKVVFQAQPRTILGKKVSQVRKQQQIPANISGDLKQPIAVAIDLAAFTKLYKKVGDTGLVYIKIEGETAERPVLISEVQHNTLSNQVLHVVFRQVDLSEKVEAEVPVVLIGELAVKNALVVTLHDAIKVEALPQDLPEKFEIDISKFTEFDQMVTFEQLDFDHSKVTLVLPEDQLSTPVVMVQEVKEEKEPEVVAAPAEGATAATPAEGAAAEGEKAEAKDAK